MGTSLTNVPTKPRPHDSESLAAAPPLTLNALDADALSEIFKHVGVPLALKLACRAIRAAAPARTKSYVNHAHETLAQLQWACSTGLEVHHKLVGEVAARGQLDQLLWIKSGASLHCSSERFEEQVKEAAATNGHVHVLKCFMPQCMHYWSHEKDVGLFFRAAGFGGQRPTLEWLAARFGEWELDSGVLTAAARGGHLDLLAWLHLEIGVDWKKDAYVQAAANGHVDVLFWFQEHARPPLMPTPADNPWKCFDTFDEAAKAGQSHVLWSATFATDNILAGRDYYSRWAYWAGWAGHVHILRWLVDLYPRSGDYEQAIIVAMRHGHLGVLKWAHERGFVAILKCCYWAEYRNYQPIAITRWFQETFPDLKE